MADKIVITKADIADPHVLAQVQAVVSSAAPAAELIGSSFGLTYTLPAFSPEEVPSLKLNDLGKPEATVLSLGPGVVWEEYALWLETLLWARPDRVLRTKGIINTPAGPLVLQSVGGSIQQPTPAPVAAVPVLETNMVFITRGLDTRLLMESFRKFVPSAQ
jgi:G3E family GTPase